MTYVLIGIIVVLSLLLWYQRRKLQQSQIEATVIKGLHIETVWIVWRLLEDIEDNYPALNGTDVVTLLSDVTGYTEMSDENNTHQEDGY